MKKNTCILLLSLCLALGGCGMVDKVQNVINETQAEEVQTMETQPQETISEETAEEIKEETMEETLPEETQESVMETYPEASYVAEDGSIVRISAERLAQLEDDVMQVIMALPEEVPESNLTQEDLDETTVQWFNTTYAAMMYQNHFDYDYIGGIFQGSQTVAPLLERDWGVTDRASAIENIKWLISSGHRTAYEEAVNELIELGFFELSLEDYLSIWEAAAQENGTDFESVRAYFTNIYTAYQQCGEAGVKAWDYCRVLQMCGSYYVAGYFSLEETMDVSLAMAQLLQAEYVSWEDMMNSYICGYDFWRGEDPNEQGTGSYWRHYYYNELKNMEGNPYATYPWDTEFVVNWR